MHDGAGRLRDEIDGLGDGLGDGRGVGCAGHDDGARHDDRRVASLVEERSDVAGVVLVVEIGGDVDCGHRGLGPRRCTSAWYEFSCAGPSASSS